MTERERETVQQAIRDLLSDGGFDAALGALCSLVGWTYPAARIATRAMTFEEFRALTRGPDRPFKDRRDPEDAFVGED